MDTLDTIIYTFERLKEKEEVLISLNGRMYVISVPTPDEITSFNDYKVGSHSFIIKCSCGKSDMLIPDGGTDEHDCPSSSLVHGNFEFVGYNDQVYITCKTCHKTLMKWT
jgi:hypothetical protein